MNSQTITIQNSEITKNQIIQVLENLTIAYQNTKSERQEIYKNFPRTEEEFTVLEEVELLTVDLRGYANQIKVTGTIKNQNNAIENLQKIQIFKIPSIAQLYFNSNSQYEKFKNYLQMLDYLRFLILEYLTLSQQA